MNSRFLIHGVVVSVVAIGLALVADAIIVSDEESVAQLADRLADDDGLDAVLSWVDVSREDVVVQSHGELQRFSDGDGDRAMTAVSRALEPFESDGVELVQRSAEVEGDHATLSVRARADGALHDARFELARSGQGWVITALTAR